MTKIDENLEKRIIIVLAIQTMSSGRMSANTLMKRSMRRRMGSSTNMRMESWKALFTIPHIVIEVGDFTFG